MQRDHYQRIGFRRTGGRLLCLLGGLSSIAFSAGQTAAPDFSAVDRHLEEYFKQEKLPSLSVGLVHGDELVYAKAFGVADVKTNKPATPKTLYRIGSITKVFTTSLLAILRDRGEVQLDDPVAKFLPPDVKLPADPRGAAAITLRHLATHTSGLPRDPGNFSMRYDAEGKGYAPKWLYRALAKAELQFPTGARCQYSNLGMGLLGHALECKTGETYAALLRQYIFDPLNMRHTVLTLTPELRELAAVGYRDPASGPGQVDFDLGCIAPCGQLASSVPDLAKFLSLQMHAGEASVKPIAGGTLTELHTPQRLVGGWGVAVGLGWHIVPDDALGDIVWHNGNMDGYFCSYMGFVGRQKVGVIVLTNCGKNVDGLGRWLLTEAVKSFGVQADPVIQKTAEALAGYFVAEPPDSMTELFHAQFLASVPAPKIKALFGQIFQEMGKCEAFTVQPGTTPRSATIVFQFANGKKLNGQLEMAQGDAPKIMGLLLKPGR